MLKYLVVLLVLAPAPSFAFETGQAASLVLGHDTLDKGGTIHGDPGPATLYSPDGIAFDGKGNLWVADSGFNRVLEFAPPFADGQKASIVLGQGNFTSVGAALSPEGLDQPYGIAFDGRGDMWVADTDSNRLVEYVPPFSSGMPASVVIGLPSFDKGKYPTAADTMAAPYGITFDGSGNLWLVDYYNNRILEYRPPLVDRMNASLVLGQYDFTGNSDGTSASKLNLPSNIVFDPSGNLWVTDSLNNRVLEFAPPFSTMENASLVLGQKGFGTSLAGISNDSLNTPYGLTFDSSGDLWVADGNNARVVEYTPPFTDGMAASVVLGQKSFQGMHMGTAADLLAEPYDVRVDGTGNLWVADTENNRIVEFATSSPVPEFGASAAVVAAVALSASLVAIRLSRRAPQ